MIFTDKKGRKIEIEGDFDVSAHHNGSRVGFIEFGEIECDEKSSLADSTFLSGMNVNEAYRRAGIAEAMMRYSVEIHGDSFAKAEFNAVGGHHAGSETYYTQEGAAFIRYCIAEDILKDTDRDEEPEPDDWG